MNRIRGGRDDTTAPKQNTTIREIDEKHSYNTSLPPLYHTAMLNRSMYRPECYEYILEQKRLRGKQ